MESLKNRLAYISQGFNINKIVLFGPRARGDFHERSDIDLAIYGSLDSTQRALFLDQIETLPYLMKFDVVFVDHNIDKKLLQNIEKEWITLTNKFTTKLQNFTNAISRLEESIEEYNASKSSVVRDGVIQRFEFTLGLAWKTTREYLIEQGFHEINSPKAVMREAFSYGLVTDQNNWIKILEDRNMTSHIYSENVASEICDRICNSYLNEFKKLLSKIS